MGETSLMPFFPHQSFVQGALVVYKLLSQTTLIEMWSLSHLWTYPNKSCDFLSDDPGGKLIRSTESSGLEPQKKKNNNQKTQKNLKSF